MTRQLSKVHRLREELNRPQPTVMTITRGRNMGFGSAAFCSVLLVGLAQIEVRNNIPLQISVFSASFALPFWLLLGIFYEHYLSLGEQSYEHFCKPLAHNLRLAVGTVAGVGLVSATGGVIYFLNKWAFCLFVVITILNVIGWIVLQHSLAQWWYAPNGPGKSEEVSSSHPEGP